MVEPQHATLRVRGGQAVFFLWQCQDAGGFVFFEHTYRDARALSDVFRTRYFGQDVRMFHRNDMGDEFRNVIGLRQDQYGLQVRFADQRLEQSGQLLPRLCIQSDERIVHNQKPRAGKQRFGELELP